MREGKKKEKKNPKEEIKRTKMEFELTIGWLTLALVHQ
jgi:hypothetical protein